MPWRTRPFGDPIKVRPWRGRAPGFGELSGSPYVRAVRRLIRAVFRPSIELVPVVGQHSPRRKITGHQPTVKAVKSSKLRFLEVVGFPRHASAREIGVGVDVAVVEHQNGKRSIAIWEVHHTGDLEPVTPVGDQVALVRAIVG